MDATEMVVVIGSLAAIVAVLAYFFGPRERAPAQDVGGDDPKGERGEQGGRAV